MSDLLSQLSEALAGKYEIEREIGRGGMATVYLARDLKHHRQVAVKVLNAELGALLGVERFLSEIRVTAKLQHPNLLPLFDSGDVGGQPFYVMPYVDGESLRSRLDREKQLPVSEAVRIAAAVATGLDYAHRQGVIHRDLKPENVLLQDGQPIVADFGIALALSKAGGERVTQTGLSLGTPHYMSPEQATGDRALDARSDIYALGAVSYEMLTGDPPHAGNSAQAIIAKVLTEKPMPLRAIRETIPVHVEYAVERALAKVPADRWSSAREFGDALEGRLPLAGQVARRASTWRRWLPWATTAGLAAACLALIARIPAAPSAPNAPISRFVISSIGDDRARIDGAAIAPDGQTVALSARIGDSLAIWIRRLDDVKARRLQGSDGATSPFFSPDGRWVGFVGDDGFVRKLPLEGGTPTTLAKMPAPNGIAWVTPDTIVAGMLQMSRTSIGLSRISATSSDAGSLTTPAEGMHHFPIVTPDGRSVLFSSVAAEPEVQPAIIALATGRASILTIPGTRFALPFGMRDNAVLYRDSAGGVWSVPVDLRSQRVSGPPVSLDASGRLKDVRDLRLASNGTLIYTRTADRSALITGVESTRPDTLVLDATAAYQTVQIPRWSPNGQTLSMLVVGTDPGVFLVDRESRTVTRLTTWRSDLPPVWSADGTRVIARRPETADSVAWWIWLDGRAAPDRVVSVASDRSIIQCEPSPDERFVATEVMRGGDRSIFVSPTGGGPSDAKLLVENARSPRWSPDGNWIAYEADVGGKSEVFVQRYPAGGRLQLSDAGATHPVWARRGTALYFESGRDIVRAQLEVTPGGLRLLRRDRVWSSNRSSERADAQYTDYDVSPSGQLAVFGVTGSTRSEVVVELNWAANVRPR
jgi:eukaryotic-like serine/threonine-protein kinase